MKVTIDTSLSRDGEVRWEDALQSSKPTVEIATTDGLVDFSKIQGMPANACIYCGSRDPDRTREHVIAYAMGGVVSIPQGSCRKCQKLTHKFETAVLRGPMQMVRYTQDMPSRTKHKDAPRSVSLFLTQNGVEKPIQVPVGEAPILLAFPTFEEPTYLTGNGTNLRLNGVVTGSFGADPEEFLRSRGADGMRLSSARNAPVAFAQMVAKTAFANAYVQKHLQRVKDLAPIVNAMLYEPNDLGRFVGTLPEPYLKRPGIQHYLGIHELKNERILYATVQFFAGSGAPIYVVVLGELRDVGAQ